MSGDCPVCGDGYSTTWEFDAGEKPGGDHFPAGVAYVHRPATKNTKKEYLKHGEGVYDGDACYQFENGDSAEDEFPPQPTIPQI